jgi:hypothetical protein
MVLHYWPRIIGYRHIVLQYLHVPINAVTAHGPHY